MNELLRSADRKFNPGVLKDLPIDQWAETVRLSSGPFSFEGHEYQREILTDTTRKQVLKKGSQLGLTETQIFKTLYGLLSGRYPQGCFYLFPSEKDVSDFSRARFNAVMLENPEISQEVRDTDSIGLKRIRKSMLYLRGARATSKIQGSKDMSTQLLSIPVDRVVFDERDNMADNMIELALTRLGHSKVQEEVYLGTPSVPDFGVSKLYDESDQRVWEIQCQACGTGTVLELEFPHCLQETAKGVFRACRKCQREIYPKDGIWVKREPHNKDFAGFWISRLNSNFTDLKKVLQDFQDPAVRLKPELYNSVLAMPYVPAENRLRQSDIYTLCGQDIMSMEHSGPCLMGVDVGRELHVVIGFRPSEKRIQICHLMRLTNFEDLHSLIGRYNIKQCVIDAEPELRKAREFADAWPGKVYLCDYIDSVQTGPVWDEKKFIVKVNRTSTCDSTHDLITKELLVLPRKSEEVALFAKHLVNIVKVLEEDQVSGSRTYKYRKLGDDHYRHALNYAWIASERTPIYISDMQKRMQELLAMKQQETYNPLTYGLNIVH